MSEVTIHVRGLDQVRKRLEAGPDKVANRLRRVTLRLAIEAQRKVKSEKLSGQMLGVKTGTLRRSINAKAYEQGDTIGASTGTNLVYGRAWHQGMVRLFATGGIGGRMPGRTRSQAAKQRHRDTAKARPFLASVLDEMKDRAREQMLAAVKGAV
jgi:hypothetical protein